MIRVEIDEQVAVELHHALGVIREIFDQRSSLPGLDLTGASTAMRDAQLAVAGGLRAAGWTPDTDGWAKRTGRTRR